MPTRFHTPTPHWTHMLRFLDRTRWGWFGGLMLLYAVGFNGQWRITPDSALHVDAARVMMRGGELVVDPVLVEKIQPGLSTALAALGQITGTTARDGFGRPAALMMLGFAAATLALTYRLFILHTDRPTAVLMVVLLGTNHLFYEMSLNLLTELPFTAGFVLLLWGHERRLKLKNGLAISLAMMLAGGLIMAAFRSVAAVVVAGYLLAELIRVVGRRDQRRLGLILLGLGAAGIGGLWLISSAVRDDVFLFGETLRHLSAERVLGNAQELCDAVLPEALMGVAIPPPIAWLVTAGMAAGAVILLRLRLLWAVLAGVFVVQWLIFLVDIRYVLPLLPVLLYGGGTLLIAGSSRLPRRRGNFTFGFVLVCVLLGNLIGIGFTIAEQRSRAFYESYRNGRYAAVQEIGLAIRQNTAKQTDVVVLTAQRIRPELAVWSGRPVREHLDPQSKTQTAVYFVGPANDTLHHELTAAGWINGRVLLETQHRPTGETWSLLRLELADTDPPSFTTCLAGSRRVSKY